MNEGETFRRIMLTLPDGMFFNIIKNYLGKIKTPFHKPDLIDSLISFLLRENTRSRIMESLDDRDIRFLTAVIFLDNPEPKKLFALLADSEDTFSIHHHLLNLEYRLLLMTDTTGKEPVIRCNPFYEVQLEREVFDLSRLFPSRRIDRRETEKSEEPPPWLQDPAAAALLSYLADNPDCLRADGSIKKRQERELKEIFPSLFDMTPAGRKLDLLLYTCESNGLVIRDDTAIGVNWQQCDAFSRLPRADRLVYLWCGTTLRIGSMPPGAAEIYKKLLYSVPADTLFPKTSFARFVHAFLLREGRSGGLQAPFIDSLTALGIIRETGGELYRSSRLFVPEMPESAGPSYIIQQNMLVSIRPETPFSTALRFSRSAEIRRYDIYSEFELTKSSYSRFLRMKTPGGNTEGIFPDTAAVPRNVAALLREWEKDFGKVKLYDGVVLTADESLRHLIEHTPGMDNFITAVPAPGIYVLNRSDYPVWREVLINAGIEQIPSLSTEEESPEVRDITAPVPLPRPMEDMQLLPPKREMPENEIFREHLYRLLEEKKLSKEAYAELKARIDTKLILFPEQMQAGFGMDSKTAEAKGINFMGKVRLIEQAIASGKDVLELIERTSSGDPYRSIVKPVKLDRSRDDLYLLGDELPERSRVEIPVKKLSLVRIRESILFSS